MAGRDELAAEVRELMRRWWSEPGEPPTADELVAYLEGELGPAEHDRIAGKLARYPDAARALAALEAFPDVEPPPGHEPLSDEELEKDWLRLRERMGWAETEAGAAMEPGEGAARRGAAADRFWWSRAAAAAALLLVGAVGGWLVGWLVARDAGAPSASVAVVQLAPVGTALGRGLSPAGEELAGADRLVLFLASAQPPRPGDYRLTIESADGGAVWQTATARPDPTGTFRVDLPGDFLAPGTFRILVAPPGDGPATEYELTIPPR